MFTKKKAFLLEFFSLAIPIMLQQLSGNILNICDTIMVGRVSPTAISAVTVANKTYMIYSLLIFGVTSGISIFMSQYYGSKNYKNCKRTFKFGMQVCAAIAMIFVLLLIISPSSVIKIFVNGDAIIDLGTQYIKIVRWSYLPVALSQMCAIYFRVFKKQNFPMVVSFVSVGANILFNYIFIYGNFGAPALGVKGAAIATTLSRIIEFVILIVILFAFNSGREIFSRETGTLSLKKKLGVIGKTVPMMINEGVWSISLSLVFRNYCHVSESYIPAITVVDNVFDLLNVAFVGCSMAAGIVIGKVLGSGNMDEARKTAKKLIYIGLGVSVVGSVLIFATAGVIPRFFSLTGDILIMSTTFLRLKAMFSWSQGYGETIYYILGAGGDVKAVFFIDGLFMAYGPLLVSSIVAYATDWPIQIVYLCTEATYLLKLFIATYYFKRGRWCRNLTKA